MLAAVTALPRLLDELDTMPLATAHGDGCTRNLLVTDTDDQFTMIDFGFWGTAPVGFDLGQLLLGEVQLGNRPASQLPPLEHACLRAYLNGLRDEGDDTPLQPQLVVYLASWATSERPRALGPAAATSRRSRRR
jgi:Ser/Thr protein kinase RdoA (MazF antagonist)